MESFLAHLTTYPSIVTTFCMVIVACYWLLAVVGALDVDFLDGDYDFEVDVENVNVMDGSANQGVSGLAGWMASWGLAGVPVTVMLTILLSTWWLITYVASSWTYSIYDGLIIQLVIGSLILFFAFVASVWCTARIIKPMKGKFVQQVAPKASSFLGYKGVIKTTAVDEEFGQVEVDDGQSGLIFNARADGNSGIKKGDTVILYDYDKDNEFYRVKVFNEPDDIEDG